MARHSHEMYCTNCSHWVYPMLSDTMSGNFEIVCGNCSHVHYRTIKDGVVIDDKAQPEATHSDSRWNKGTDDWTGDRIHVPASACSKEKRTLGKIAQFRQKVAAGLAS